MIRTFRYPLHPNKEQARQLENVLVFCCHLYNVALFQRRDAYRKQGHTVTKFDQFKELVELRQNDRDFNAVASELLRSALKRLDLAYQAFFRRLRNGEKPGFPRFKSQGRYNSFSFMQAPRIKDNLVLIPKIGYIRFNQYRPLKGKPLDATVQRTARGWEICIQCDVGAAPPKVVPVTHTGIDVGLTSFGTLADGQDFLNPRFYRNVQDKLANQQRVLFRKQCGSNSRKRQKRLVARTHLHIKNQRLQQVRLLACYLFSRYDVVSYEDLNIQEMVRNHKLSKSILDAAWGTFVHALTCKAEDAGKYAVPVDPRGTSQRCSACQAAPEKRKKLSDRVHVCACGASMDRDHNAARNIDALGLSVLETQGICLSGTRSQNVWQNLNPSISLIRPASYRSIG